MKRNDAQKHQVGLEARLNFFLINESFHLVDLPGYGWADAPRKVHEQFLRLVELYLAQSPDLRLLVLLLDSRRDPSERDFDLLKWLRLNEVPHSVVLTKADKFSRSQLMQREKAIRDALSAGVPGHVPDLLAVSSVSGLGRRELWSMVARAVESPPPPRTVSFQAPDDVG